MGDATNLNLNNRRLSSRMQQEETPQITIRYFHFPRDSKRRIIGITLTAINILSVASTMNRDFLQDNSKIIYFGATVISGLCSQILINKYLDNSSINPPGLGIMSICPLLGLSKILYNFL